MRARAGIAKSFLYPQVDGGANYRARGATSAEPDETDDEDTFHQSASYGFQLAWELDLFGKLRRAEGEPHWRWRWRVSRRDAA